MKHAEAGHRLCGGKAEEPQARGDERRVHRLHQRGDEAHARQRQGEGEQLAKNRPSSARALGEEHELRAEQQTLALYEGQTRVNALLEALAQGPEDDSLVSLLPEDFAVISSRIENGVCYLNLPANVSLPENEAERGLMLSALEQSILSLGGVDEVQFLIEGSAEPDGYR